MQKEQQQQAEEKLADGKPKLLPAEMRMQKDMGELQVDKSTTIDFPEGKDKIMHFVVTIRPIENTPYHGGSFKFDVNVPQGYPHEAPKVKCLTKVIIISQENLILRISAIILSLHSFSNCADFLLLRSITRTSISRETYVLIF